MPCLQPDAAALSPFCADLCLVCPMEGQCSPLPTICSRHQQEQQTLRRSLGRSCSSYVCETPACRWCHLGHMPSSRWCSRCRTCRASSRKWSMSSTGASSSPLRQAAGDQCAEALLVPLLSAQSYRSQSRSESQLVVSCPCHAEAAALQVRAEVVPVSLDISDEELSFAFSLDNWAPFVGQASTLPLGSRWSTQTQAFCSCTVSHKAVQDPVAVWWPKSHT